MGKITNKYIQLKRIINFIKGMFKLNIFTKVVCKFRSLAHGKFGKNKKRIMDFIKEKIPILGAFLEPNIAKAGIIIAIQMVIFRYYIDNKLPLENPLVYLFVLVILTMFTATCFMYVKYNKSL